MVEEKNLLRLHVVHWQYPLHMCVIECINTHYCNKNLKCKKLYFAPYAVLSRDFATGSHYWSLLLETLFQASISSPLQATTISQLSFYILISSCIYMFLFYVCIITCVPQHGHKDQRTACWNQFFPSVIWSPENWLSVFRLDLLLHEPLNHLSIVMPPL